MKFDYSWSSVTDPGLATDYFNCSSFPHFDTSSNDFKLVNAWYLAEVSRLSYRVADNPSRNEILADAQLEEIKVITSKSNRCAILRSTRGGNPFHIVVFRGTSDVRNWITNVSATTTTVPGYGKVHKGFWSAVNTLSDGLKMELEHVDTSIYYTGHSLGGALAILMSIKTMPYAVYTLGSPRIGNQDFSESTREFPIYRLINHLDIVPTLPLAGPVYRYQHTGKQIYFENENPDPQNKQPNINSAFDATSFSITHPPEIIYDHAPINYVAHLHIRLAAQSKDFADE